MRPDLCSGSQKRITYVDAQRRESYVSYRFGRRHHISTSPCPMHYRKGCSAYDVSTGYYTIKGFSTIKRSRFVAHLTWGRSNQIDSDDTLNGSFYKRLAMRMILARVTLSVTRQGMNEILWSGIIDSTRSISHIDRETQLVILNIRIWNTDLRFSGK